MPFQLTCEGASGSPVITGDVLDACTAVGGTVDWVESAGFMPELSLEDGGFIAGAIIGLWALGWAFRALKRQAQES